MGTIKIEAYGKVIYEQTKPDKVCFAIAKDQERKDNEFLSIDEKQKNFRNNDSLIKT